jgi:hypothetical protein
MYSEFQDGTFTCSHGIQIGVGRIVYILKSLMHLLIIVGVLVASFLLWLAHQRWKREHMSDDEVASAIEHYLYGGGPQDWGNFVEVRFANPRLEYLRKLCLEAESKLPDERELVLNELMADLRSKKFKHRLDESKQ